MCNVKYKIGTIVEFSGSLNTKTIGYIEDYNNDTDTYKVNLGRSSYCLNASYNTIKSIKSNKLDNNEFTLNSICLDYNTQRLIKITSKKIEGFYLVEDIITNEKYITDNIIYYDISTYNKKIINWCVKYKGYNGIIKFGKYKGKKVKIITYINVYSNEFNLPSMFVYCIPLDKLNSMINTFPDNIDIIEKEDY